MCFSGYAHVLCTRHLKQNACKYMYVYMKDTVGMNMKTRNEILNVIFGADDIVQIWHERLSYSRKQSKNSMIIEKWLFQ
jgi:hypothetical protein